MRGWFVAYLLGAAGAAGLASAAERSFDSAGVQIAYLDEGVGETVVLLHGFGASAAEMWMRPPLAPTPFVPILAREFRVLAPDLRGHGASDKPHESGMYGGQMAEDVIRLLDRLEVAKAHIVGYSLGATVAGKLLAEHPERLLSVTFGGGGPLLRPSPEVVEVIEATAASLEEGRGMAPLVMALVPEGAPKPSLFHASTMSAIFLKGKDQRALAAVMRGQRDLEVAEAQLAASEVPILFVHGGREATCKRELIANALAVLPHAEVAVIKGRDHLDAVGSPAFRERVLAFVRAHREPEELPARAAAAGRRGALP